MVDITFAVQAHIMTDAMIVVCIDFFANPILTEIIPINKERNRQSTVSEKTFTHNAADRWSGTNGNSFSDNEKITYIMTVPHIIKNATNSHTKAILLLRSFLRFIG